MRNLSPALIVMVALGMGAMQWAQSQGLSSIDASEMRLAVKTGDAGRVRTLIQRGVDANAKDADGYTPLHQAAVDGFPEAVDALLATTPKPDVDAKTNNGYTALHLAAAGGTQGHLKVVEALLEADATVDEEAPGERTALHIAAWGGHAEVVEALLDEDATVDEKATGGWTPLHLAAHGTMQGHLDSVQALLDEGADRNIEAQERKPWQYAWERKQRAIVDILNPLIPSALINAVADDDVDEVRDLIAAGYSAVNEKNSIGQSTVYLAVVRKHRGVLQALLVADDIDVNVKGLGGYAALHLAAYYQDSDADTPTGRNLLGLVTDLIAADGVDVNLVGGTSLGAYRPLTIAIDRDNDKAEQALRDAGATGIPTGTLAFSPTATLAVPEGGTANLGVKLSVKPDTTTGKVVPPILTPRSDNRISISKTNITFTPSNWNTSQTIRVTSTMTDEDAVDVEGITITFYTTSNNGFKFSSSEIEKSVKIDDKDEVGFVASRTGTRDNRLQIREGQFVIETDGDNHSPTQLLVLFDHRFFRQLAA
ncbi:MAG: ankyrin repeat domain-containing protein [Ectothiorhodospiraceae bacterium AqS1]|nr:ankyrin repeat domain-containing protein [Ectothiorhodospiraceae bacterium AqS1]